MPKRKAAATTAAQDAPLRRSTRQRTAAATTSEKEKDAVALEEPGKKSGGGKTVGARATGKGKVTGKEKGQASAKTSGDDEDDFHTAPPVKNSKSTKDPKDAETKDDNNAPVTQKQSSSSKGKKAAQEDGPAANDNGTRQYWLMKAEPETRYEKGKDISFSIDDLAAKKVPEPWDGIRNYVARNNLRAMKKGDLAFFSHSNCKVPGIVGTMEIVQEHSPDLCAQDPKNPYYDPKASPEDPRWSVVHVEFRTKFKAPITLAEMREFGKSGGALENMQMLKQSRLSVSRVSQEEWDFIMQRAEDKSAVDA